MNELEDLWYGNVIPYEQFLNGNYEYKQLLTRTVKHRDEFEATLTNEQKTKLTDYDAACAELNSTSELSAFSFGFRLGVKLMIETIYSK